ncbi:JAB N-terminal domain-containing protein [Actinoplanes sp. NPDC049118]|uniref:JAB N-terminal domain-containing protein n=1 Tax=Actinoplanes sp. NPDC049118 TaxID=3155769 RepID=UPI0033D6D7B0
MSVDRVGGLRQKPNVLLYRDDVRKPFAFVPLFQLLRLALGDRVPRGRAVDLAVALLDRPDPTPSDEGSFVHLHGNLGVFKLYVFVDKQRTYTGEHPVRELLEPLLRQLVAGIAPAAANAPPPRWFFEITRLNEGYMVVLPSAPFAEETAGSEEQAPQRLPLTVRRVGEEPPAGADQAAEPEARSLPTVILRIRVGQDTDDIRALSDLIRPAPKVEGAVEVDLDRPRSVPFSIRKVSAPELPLLETAGLELRPDQEDAVTVVLRPGPHRDLCRELDLSLKMEEGGFLAGRVFRVSPGEDRYVVLIEQVLPAKHTGASSVHFTFTGDSFQEMTRELSGGPMRLVGWYHTHLFSSDGAIELSGVDVKLHHSTFRQPWQVAGLINLTRTERRLRFYNATDDDMETCSLWVTDERDGRGAARHDLGDR